MNDKLDLTIGIVSYHNVSDITTAVDSIELYTEPSIKKLVYIIDNADNEADYQMLVQKYSDVKYVKTNQNLGFGGGHNYILQEINSDYHAIVNPDIILHEDSFKTILEYMEKDESIGVCAPRLVDEQGEFLYVYRREITFFDMLVRFFFKKIFKKRYRYHIMYDADYTQPFQVPFTQGSFLVIRTKLLKELKGFDERYFMYMEDADLCKRVNEVSKVMYFPGTTVTHKWEKGSHKNRKLFKMHLSSMKKYFKKWGFRWR